MHIFDTIKILTTERDNLDRRLFNAEGDEREELAKLVNAFNKVRGHLRALATEAPPAGDLFAGDAEATRRKPPGGLAARYE